VASYLDDPFSIDGRGRAATTDRDDHVRDMIRQVLFTNPGERVNRPDFGCGLLRLVFQPSGEPLTTLTQFLIQSALQRWLGDVIQVERISVEAEGERLSIEIGYLRLDTGEPGHEVFAAPLPQGAGA